MPGNGGCDDGANEPSWANAADTEAASTIARARVVALSTVFPPTFCRCRRSLGDAKDLNSIFRRTQVAADSGTFAMWGTPFATITRSRPRKRRDGTATDRRDYCRAGTASA